jgi:hypothetical protein
MERPIMSAVDEREFNMLLGDAAAKVPEHLRVAVMASCREAKGMAAKLRTPRTAAAEPSNTFSLTNFARGK